MILRLTPSTYSVSNTSYVSITDVNNMYTNTDSDTYTTIDHTRAATTVVSFYIKGFDFSQIPEGAVINSLTVKVKANEKSLSTSTTYIPRACNNTALYSSLTASNVINTTIRTITFSGTLEPSVIVSAGSNFGIRLQLRRNSQNTTGYLYIYGAEIEVDYDVLSEPEGGHLH